MTPGAVLLGGGRCRFRVWAPRAQRVELRLAGRAIALAPAPDGHFAAEVEDVHHGDRYRLSLDGGPDRPDPVSRWQPEGVHGPSAVLDPAVFRWTDAGFSPPEQRDLVIYELHIGTFTPEGTFDAATRRFAELRELGVTAVEPLPIAQFPGGRNWGYDGVHPWAAQDTYGGPEGFARFVDAAHAAGLAVILDIVHNHLGPEGNYLGEFGPYFTDRYRTPWGHAINFAEAGSDEVRRYFIGSAVAWVRDHHVDGFRLDAIDTIVDTSARPYLAELTDAVHAEGRRHHKAVVVIAESDLNDRRVVVPTADGGLGFDAAWSDDLHHATHALLTGERDGYYADFGEIEHLAAALARGWTYDGRRSAYRQRLHGNDPTGLPADRFVVALQNHDQVGNRARGDRIDTLLAPARRRLAAAIVLLSPFVPLLFMGEEHGERRPFLYFTSHGDPDLVEAVRRGRREEFARFASFGADEVPDPQDEATFRASIVDPAHGDEGVRALYRALLRARRETPDLLDSETPGDRLRVEGRAIVIERARSALVFNLGPARSLPVSGPEWRVALDTADPLFGGDGSCEGEVAEDSAVFLVR